MIDRYFEAYPGVRRYLDQTVADAKRTGLCRDALWTAAVPSLSSRCATPSKRSFGEPHGHETTPMQGTAADIIKIAMVRVAQQLCATRASTPHV